MSIPDNLEICTFDLCWLDWPQAEEPLSAKTLQYVKGINVLEDVRLLDQHLRFRRVCLRNIRVSGTLLKKGVDHGLNLAQIGSILCREDDEIPSVLEKLVLQADNITHSIYSVTKQVHFDYSPKNTHDGGEKLEVKARKFFSPAVDKSKKFASKFGLPSTPCESNACLAQTNLFGDLVDSSSEEETQETPAAKETREKKDTTGMLQPKDNTGAMLKTAYEDKTQ